VLAGIQMATSDNVCWQVSALTRPPMLQTSMCAPYLAGRAEACMVKLEV